MLMVKRVFDLVFVVRKAIILSLVGLVDMAMVIVEYCSHLRCAFGKSCYSE